MKSLDDIRATLKKSKYILVLMVQNEDRLKISIIIEKLYRVAFISRREAKGGTIPRSRMKIRECTYDLII